MGLDHLGDQRRGRLTRAPFRQTHSCRANRRTLTVKEHCRHVDLALFSPVQVHYTADPVLRGAEDPLPVRMDLVRGARDLVAFPVAELRQVPDLDDSIANADDDPDGETPAGFTPVGSDASFDEALRAIGAGNYNDGTWRAACAAAFNTDLSEEDATRAIRARVREQLEIEGRDRTEDADRHVLDVPRQVRGAYRLRSGQHGRQAKLIAGVPRDPLAAVDLETAERALREVISRHIPEHLPLDEAVALFEEAAINGWLDQPPPAAAAEPHRLINVTMGVGKTEETLRAIDRHIRSAYEHGCYTRSIVVWYVVPRVELAFEVAFRLRELAGHDRPYEVRTVIGRTKPLLDGSYLCQRHDRVQTLQERGISDIFTTSCRSGTSTCPYFRGCAYHRQYFAPDEAVVYIMPTNYLLAGVETGRLPAPSVLVIDESPLDAVIGEWLPRTKDEMLEGVPHDADLPLEEPATGQRDLLRGGTHVVGRLTPRDVLHDVLTIIERGPGSLAEIARRYPRPELRVIIAILAERAKELRKQILPDMPMGEVKRRLRRYPRIIAHRWLERLTMEMPFADHRSEPYSISYHDGRFWAQWRQEVRLRTKRPLLLLDGTGDPVLWAAALGLDPAGIETTTINGRRNAEVTLVCDAPCSIKRVSTEERGPVHEVVQQVLAIDPERTAFFTYKGAREVFEPPANVRVNHFGNLRGDDSYRDCTRAVLLGRLLPPPAGVERHARALCYDHDRRLRLAENYVRRPAPIHGGFEQRLGTWTWVHPDDLIERLRWQTCEGELLQALDRIRSVRADQPKEVLLITDHVPPIEVHHVVRWPLLAHDNVGLQLLWSVGWVPVHVGDGLRLLGSVGRPDLPETQVRTHLKALKAQLTKGVIRSEFLLDSSIRNSNRMSGMRRWCCLQPPDRWRYRPAGQSGAGADRGIYSYLPADDLRSAVEVVLGPLAKLHPAEP